MVQYQDDSGQNHEPLLNVSAGGNIDLDVRGRQRDGSSDPVTINSEGIDAGGNILIDEEQDLEDGPATGSGGGVQVSATQQAKKGTYHSYYYPDNTAASPTAVDDGLYGNMNDTSNVLTIYDFTGRDAELALRQPRWHHRWWERADRPRSDRVAADHRRRCHDESQPRRRFPWRHRDYQRVDRPLGDRRGDASGVCYRTTRASRSYPRGLSRCWGPAPTWATISI